MTPVVATVSLVLLLMLVSGASAIKEGWRRIGALDDLPGVSVTALFQEGTGVIQFLVTFPVGEEGTSYLGFGFGQSNMVGSYAIIVERDGRSVTAQERLLTGRSFGVPLDSGGIEVLNSEVSDGVVIALLQRPLAAEDSRAYSFDANDEEASYIMAYGTALGSKHTAKAGGVANLGEPACVADAMLVIDKTYQSNRPTALLRRCTEVAQALGQSLPIGVEDVNVGISLARKKYLRTYVPLGRNDLQLGFAINHVLDLLQRFATGTQTARTASAAKFFRNYGKFMRPEASVKAIVIFGDDQNQAGDAKKQLLKAVATAKRSDDPPKVLCFRPRGAQERSYMTEVCDVVLQHSSSQTPQATAGIFHDIICPP